MRVVPVSWQTLHDSQAVTYKLWTLEYGKKGHELWQSIFPFRSSRGIDEEAVRGQLRTTRESLNGPLVFICVLAEIVV